MKTRKHFMMKRVMLVLLAVSMLAVIVPGTAETVSNQAAATETSLPDAPYRIVLTAPGGWTNNSSADVSATIYDQSGLGWKKIEYRMNNGLWIDCEPLFSNGNAQITVHENGTFTMRITDPSDRKFEEFIQVNCIDRLPPTVSAFVAETVLHIDVQDDLSGVSGVQVNSMLFTSITGTTLDVELDQNMIKFEKLAVRAFDYAGNFSEPITLENPNYVEPEAQTPAPTVTVAPATATPSAKPDATVTSTGAPSANLPAATATAIPTPTQLQPSQGLGSSLVYVPDDEWPEATPSPTPVPTAEPTAEPTTAPSPTPIIQTEYIPLGPGMPYQADGNSHTLDVLYSAATNKQFITLQSKDGNTYYLVIDYDKPIDEEAEMYETYFVNLVDERDLLALMSDEEIEEMPTPTPEIIYVTPEPTIVPDVTPEPSDGEQKTPDLTTAILPIAAIVILGCGVVVLLRKKGRPKKPTLDNDFDMEDDESDEDDPNQI